jgi:hypothetical protein
VLEEKLGSGGMGTVFRAKDLRKVEARDRQPYLAIKVLNNDFREHPEAFIALQREATKSQALAHPNIVSIFDFDKDGDLPFITMELLEGQELAQLLRAYPNGLPETMAWQVIRGICAGLGHAHSAGIVHADFKPGNVFVSPSNAPKILDFGIARAVQMTETATDDTLFDPARLAALTPAYASREMLAGEDPEPRDDLYSLGIVIYLILTGRHPFGRLSAEDAAKEGLKPERPKGVTRRQWQAISRCLAFTRQDRPEDMREVERLLLMPSPWPVRGAVAVTAVLLVALSVNYLMGDAELSEVKEEVRQTTLLDAQLDRITALLESPVFGRQWERAVQLEYGALERLDETGETRTDVAEEIAAAYQARIVATENLGKALALLDRGRAYGPLDEAARLLEQRSIAAVRNVLDMAKPDAGWLDELAAALGRARAAFPQSPELAEVEVEVGNTLEQLAREAIADDQLDEAERLVAELEGRFFDAVELSELQGLIRDARDRELARREAEALEALRQEQMAGLDEALGASCLRIDLAQIAALPVDSLGPSAGQKIAERLGDCLTQLAELDPDRAASLQREIDRQFGDTLALAPVTVDPCGLSYLVGNGAQMGRGAYCADHISDEVEGPRLVVVPAADENGPYAITKEEISWSEFKTFCVEQNGCTQEELETPHLDDRLPVTLVSLETARAYARWLSERTGYTYRLPTAEEWRWAARGEPDPNRNCRVQVDGVQRGGSPVAAASGQGNDFGLLNMLGNVQEWVVDGGHVVAVGGSFSDPIGECLASTARVHEGQPSVDTGFRLVRELS